MQTKEIVRPHQPDLLEYASWRKKQVQDECKHKYRRYPLLDSERDRIIKIAVCQKCGQES